MKIGFLMLINSEPKEVNSMVTQLEKRSKKLYDVDYNLWVLETVKQLENREFNALDLDNLIEEVADLSRRDKRKLESLLTRLIEHLLKIKYWQSEKDRNFGHWQGEVRTFRKQINKELKASPSLKVYCQEIFEECYQDAREIVSDRSQLPLTTFPKKPIANFDQVLDENWFP
jgi:DNA repair ATPase RecN